jgi:general secretion pathway protein G
MIFNKRHTQAQEAFTLIEIVIAIAIVGLMAAVVGPAFLRFLGMGKESQTTSNIKALQSAIMQYNIDTNTYPQTLQDLVRRPTDEKISKKWRGPYLEGDEMPDDGWGNPFVYRPTGNPSRPYELYSYGPHGMEGTKEERIGVVLQ